MAKSKQTKAPKTGPRVTRTGSTGTTATAKPRRQRILVMGPTGKIRKDWRAL